MNNNYLYEYFRNNDYKKELQDVYVVVEGDTLYNISKKLGVELEELMKANNLSNYWIFPNQVLVIPRAKENDGMYFEEYKIKFNDTLEKIAEDFNVTVGEILKYNDLGALKLLGNQEITIPRTYKKYTIVATDTLDYIIRKTNMTAYELLEANFSNLLQVGTVINVK